MIASEHFKELKTIYHRAKMNAYLEALNKAPPPPERKEKWSVILHMSKGGIPAFTPMWQWLVENNHVTLIEALAHEDHRTEMADITKTLRASYKAYVKDTHYNYVEGLAVAAGVKIRTGPRQRTKDLRDYWAKRQEEPHPPTPAPTQTYAEWIKMRPAKPVVKSLETYDWNPYKTCE